MLNLHYKRLQNKFFFLDYKGIKVSKPQKFEFYIKVNEPKDLLLFTSYIENFLGHLPLSVNAGYKFNTQGKKVYSKNLVLILSSYFYIENFLKYYYLFLNNNSLRSKYINNYLNNFYSFSFMNNSFNYLLVNNYFALVDILFEVKLRFLSSKKYLNFFYLNSFGLF